MHLFLACCVLVLTGACAADPAADIVVYGATWTGDGDRPWAEAVAIRGEIIVVGGRIVYRAGS